MATTAQTAPRPAAEEASALASALNWIRGHRQAATYIAVALVVGAGLFWWNALSNRRSEEIAGQQLVQARLAFESRNFPLASNELSRMVENYAGTHAAEEGTILLAQIRLLQGQSQQAIQLLKRFAPRAEQAYGAQAYGLLGAAYEDAGQPREAGQAYEKAAHGAELPFLRGQFLSDAGRAWVAAGDTLKAVEAYKGIIAELSETGPVTEAKVRLGELTKGRAALQ